MPGLDVLRGLAILMVLCYHGLSGLATDQQAHLSRLQFYFLNFFFPGYVGVHLFFVLSGFLITGILLDTRHNPTFYKPFYLRRIVRIVPAYLLMIAVLKATGVISWTFTTVSLLYLCNLSGLLHAKPEYGSFWSLSVEEQFYLVWPFLVRNLRTRTLFLLSIALVFFTSVLHLALLYAPPALQDIYTKTWDVGDFFAAGAALAILVRTDRFRTTLPKLAVSLAVGGFALLALGQLSPYSPNPLLTNLRTAVHLTPFVPIWASVVLGAYLKPEIASLLVTQPLLFLGRISYGLYLIHPWLFSHVEKLWPVTISSNQFFTQDLLRFLLASTLSIALAWLSRNTLEEFFLRRKPAEPKFVEHLRLNE